MLSIILGAGEGTRLRPHTLDRPKCMVELAGKPLLIHQIETLKAVGVHDIHVVTGYRAESIEELGLKTTHNPRFASTNMVVSMMAASHLFDGQDDVLITYSDIVFEPRVIEALGACDEPLAIPINRDWQKLWSLRMSDPLQDAETLKLNSHGDVVEIGRKPDTYEDIEGQYMGIIRIRADHAVRFAEIYHNLDSDRLFDGREVGQMYMTSFLQHIIDEHFPIRAVLVSGGWLEVDTAEELELYARLYSERQLDSICSLSSLPSPPLR